MERLVHQLNLEHYLKLLETETDPEKRRLLVKLLFEEEGRFDAEPPETREMDALILTVKSRSGQQTQVVAQLEREGRDTAAGRLILENLNELLATLLAHRQDLEPERRRSET